MEGIPQDNLFFHKHYILNRIKFSPRGRAYPYMYKHLHSTQKLYSEGLTVLIHNTEM